MRPKILPMVDAAEARRPVERREAPPPTSLGAGRRPASRGPTLLAREGCRSAAPRRLPALHLPRPQAREKEKGKGDARRPDENRAA